MTRFVIINDLYSELRGNIDQKIELNIYLHQGDVVTLVSDECDYYIVDAPDGHSYAVPKSDAMELNL